MFKCYVCKEKTTELEDMYAHIENEHNNLIPKNWVPAQYYYYLKTGKSEGRCIICKKPTSWNTASNKYNRFCNNPACKEKYVNEFKIRMISKYGKVHLLNSPEQQKKMLANRKISGEYAWSDNSLKLTYTGSYEHDFLKLLDVLFNWDPTDIITPSPHTYYYEYEGEQKFYIPDVFIPSLNLEIEIKDGGDNPNNHHKIQSVDKVKEKLKDEVLMSQTNFHYIKIVNKNYESFFEFLFKLKKEYSINKDADDIKRIFIVNESSIEIKTDKFNEIILEGAFYKLLNNTINFGISMPHAVTIGNIGMVNRIKKICQTAKTKDDMDKALEITERHINLMKRNKEYKINHGNIIPQVDKQIKEVVLTKTISKLEEIRDDLKNKMNIIKESVTAKSINSPSNLYFLSEEKLDNVTIKPRIPDNYMVRHNYEENKTLRISFSSSIDGALTGLSMNLTGKTLYVYEPSDYTSLKIKNVTDDEVPDASLTDEVWVLNPVKLKKIGKIKVIDAKPEPLKFKYGNEIWAETYRWIFKEVEENKQENKNQLYPVFVLLTYTDTLMARLIRFHTGDPYSHASISFDSSMFELYSFGRKYKNSDMTFISENIDQGIYRDVKDNASYSLYVTFVNKHQLDDMITKLDEFKKKQDKLKFSFFGLFNIAIGKETHRENEFFCSQFVAEVLKAGNAKMLNRDTSLYSPYDLTKIKEFQFVSRGKMQNYDKFKTDDKVNQLIKK